MLLPAGVISSAVTVPNGITLLGAAAGKKVTPVTRTTAISGETIISAPLAVGSNVSLDGLTLTASITAKNSSALTVKNTIFRNVTPTGTTHADKAVLIMTQWTQPIKLIIENCYFENNNGVYNVFELNAPLANGTSIKGNYFAKEAGSHNIINIYAIEDNAKIIIDNNYFEYSASAMRIGAKGNVQNAVIDFLNNSYVETDLTIDENIYEEINTGKDIISLPKTVSWGGFTTIQPYGTETSDMSGITIKYNGNTPADAQMYVNYVPDKSTFLDATKRPIIIIDGKVETDDNFYGVHTIDVRLER